MNLKQTLLLSISIFLLLVGVHQTMLHGFAYSYWIFMLLIVFLILYQMIKSKQEDPVHTKNSVTKKSNKEAPSHTNNSSLKPKNKGVK